MEPPQTADNRHRPTGMSEWKHYIQIGGGGESLFIVLVEIKAKNMIKDLETNMY